MAFAALCLSGTLAAAPAPETPTTHVDGVSDQTLPAWDGSFAGGYFPRFFREAWSEGPHPHLTLARYVVQWDAVSGRHDSARSAFEEWLIDARSLGLTPVLALTSFDGIRPESSAEYQIGLEAILDRAEAAGYPVRYLEAWNEPNNQGGYRAVAQAAIPAHFANAASATCERGYGCTVIAGDFEDAPDVLAYAQEYVRNLRSLPLVWGVHPYQAVKSHDDTGLLRLEARLPAGAQIWITEVGAYRCERFDGEARGELAQAEDASWLVNTLIPALAPMHVFYYSFLFGNGQHRQPPCERDSADSELYAPGADPNAPDAPRAAAAFIYDGRGFPWAYTGAPAAVSSSSATLTGSAYPGGLLDARYHFEYGLSASYGLRSAEGDAGSGLGSVAERVDVTGLLPQTVYHYRMVTSDSEGTGWGPDRLFETRAR